MQKSKKKQPLVIDLQAVKKVKFFVNYLKVAQTGE